MSKTLWKGTLNLGRLAIPVGLLPTHENGTVEFRTLHADCERPITMRRWCEQCERELEPTELVKGWEVAKGVFVVVDQAELDALAPEQTHAIEIHGFADVDQLDPVLVDRSYHLAPQTQQVAREPYALLVDAQRETGAVAIATFVAWSTEHVCAVRPAHDRRALVLQILRPLEDLADVSAIDLADLPLDPEQLGLARELIDRLHKPLRKLAVAPATRTQVTELLDAKLAGEKFSVPARPERDRIALPRVDLTAALKESIRDTRRRRRSPKPTAV